MKKSIFLWLQLCGLIAQHYASDEQCNMTDSQYRLTPVEITANSITINLLGEPEERNNTIMYEVILTESSNESYKLVYGSDEAFGNFTFSDLEQRTYYNISLIGLIVECCEGVNVTINNTEILDSYYCGNLLVSTTVQTSIGEPTGPTFVNFTSETNSITLIWTHPPEEVVASFEILYTYIAPCNLIIPTGVVRFSGSSREYTLDGLEEFSTYNIVFYAIYEESIIHEIFNVTTLPKEPDWPPGNVRKVATSNTSIIIISWEHVNCIHQNGQIKGYKVIYGIVETYALIRTTSHLIDYNDSLEYTAIDVLPNRCYIVQVYSVSEHDMDGRRSAPLNVCTTNITTTVESQDPTIIIEITSSSSEIPGPTLNAEVIIIIVLIGGLLIMVVIMIVLLIITTHTSKKLKRNRFAYPKRILLKEITEGPAEINETGFTNQREVNALELLPDNHINETIPRVKESPIKIPTTSKGKKTPLDLPRYPTMRLDSNVAYQTSPISSPASSAEGSKGNRTLSTSLSYAYVFYNTSKKDKVGEDVVVPYYARSPVRKDL